MAKKKKTAAETEKPRLQTINSPLLNGYNNVTQQQDLFPEFISENQVITEESEQSPQPSAKKKEKETPIVPTKEKIEQVTQPATEVIPNEEEKSLWNDFILLAEESQKAKKKKEAQVWINEDLKNILERLRCAGVRLPIKHLMNGILKAFLTANQKDIEKLLRQKIKL